MQRVRAAGVLVVVLAVACGKHRLDEQPVSSWDPPTAAYGFSAVPVDACIPGSPDSRVVPTLVPSSEEIARSYRPLRHVVSDGEGVYWSVGGAAPGAVYRAARAPGPGLWNVEPIARDEVDPGDITIAADRRVYWAVSEQRASADHARPSPAGIRSFDRQTGRTETLATEEARPERLVASESSVFWIAAPNHLREAKDHVVKNVLTISMMPALLAVDADAAYVFTSDRALVRVGRDGSRPVVLVSSTSSRPVDIAAAGPWVYWIEEGPHGERCDADGVVLKHLCRGGYEMKRAREQPSGSLHRVPSTGGPVTDIADDLPDVEALTLSADGDNATAWITTARGPLRVRASGGPASAVTYEPLPMFEGRLAVLGGARVIATDTAPARVLLLAIP
jgi:hypothetical protein